MKKSTTEGFRVLLRQWREQRRLSQIELSANVGISQRHLSFIELGRSAPSREVVVCLAEALAIPYRERNALLLSAGFAPLYEEGGWDDQDLRRVNEALQRMLRQQEPYPALVLDRCWNVVQTNSAAPRFFGCFADLAVRPKPRNLLHLVFDPEGLRPHIANWNEVGRMLIQRVRREAVGQTLDPQSAALLESLMAYPGTPRDWRTPAAGNDGPEMPVIPLRFSWNDKVLSYFSMLTTLAAPQSIAAQELRIECMFPFDDATEALHPLLVSQG